MSAANETLDNDSIISSECDIHFPNGYTYSLGLRITMILVGFIGILFIIIGGLGYFAGPLFILTTIYTLSSLNGTEISSSNRYLKAYTSSFWIKRGGLIPSIFLTDLSVLRMGNAVDEINSPAIPGNKVYELFLMTPDHRKRFFITAYDTKEEAFASAKALAKRLEKVHAYYQPKVSDSTRAMRYERH